jgi:hypothetical protein
MTGICPPPNAAATIQAPFGQPGNRCTSDTYQLIDIIS